MAVGPHQDGLISGISPVVDRWRQGVEKLANEAGMVRVEIRIKGMLKRPFGKAQMAMSCNEGTTISAVLHDLQYREDHTRYITTSVNNNLRKHNYVLKDGDELTLYMVIAGG